ncbi:hypothetical protein [Paracoccus liaowanqingii]|uniref:hypothetical protein n=1 Tax=Paracoccus liaowanqingii TaxID=2560053 RepID=UPI00159BA1AC|nr:hypothetical protein [Paracoccus liaowanqingii]
MLWRHQAVECLAENFADLGIAPLGGALLVSLVGVQQKHDKAIVNYRHLVSFHIPEQFL